MCTCAAVPGILRRVCFVGGRRRVACAVPEWLDLTARCSAAGAGDLNRSYQMRMKAARALYAEVSERYPTMPFSIRSLDQRNVQLGMKVRTLALLGLNACTLLELGRRPRVGGLGWKELTRIESALPPTHTHTHTSSPSRIAGGDSVEGTHPSLLPPRTHRKISTTASYRPSRSCSRDQQSWLHSSSSRQLCRASTRQGS